MRYITESHVRFLAGEYGRHVGRGFLHRLSEEVERLVIRAAKEPNGGRKTLDRDVLDFVLKRGKI